MHCRYIALLRKALDPSDAGKGLYFSPTADLTLTQQRAAELEEQGGKEDGPFTGRTEQRFFWNRHLLAPFLGEQPSRLLCLDGLPTSYDRHLLAPSPGEQRSVVQRVMQYAAGRLVASCHIIASPRHRISHGL